MRKGDARLGPGRDPRVDKWLARRISAPPARQIMLSLPANIWPGGYPARQMPEHGNPGTLGLVLMAANDRPDTLVCKPARAGTGNARTPLRSKNGKVFVATWIRISKARLRKHRG